MISLEPLDWFDVMDEHNLPLLTEREILRNLQAIVADADKLPTSEVARNAVGVLTTENRKVWSGLRFTLSRDRRNAACLRVVDQALFVVCLDDVAPDSLAELCGNFLCGTYRLVGGVQVGTCTNRWYDKVRMIFSRRHSNTSWSLDIWMIVSTATDNCDCGWCSRY
jgi:carnitine O-acetyltransferase